AAKASGAKVFARDIRAQDMPGWPRRQGHALLLKATDTGRLYQGLDLSLLGAELQPDRLVTAADLARDRIRFPWGHDLDPLLPEGQMPMFIGHPVALLIWHDFERYRQAKKRLQFNQQAIRYGAAAEPFQTDPYGSFRFVRVGGDDPYQPDTFSSLKDSLLFPAIRERKPTWPQGAKLTGDLTQQGLYHAERMREQLEQPPQDWLVFDERYT